jgi:hypothetical protein
VSTVSPRCRFGLGALHIGTIARLGELHGKHCPCMRGTHCSAEGVGGPVSGAAAHNCDGVYSGWLSVLLPSLGAHCTLRELVCWVTRHRVTRAGRWLDLGRSPRVRASASKLLADG